MGLTIAYGKYFILVERVECKIIRIVFEEFREGRLLSSEGVLKVND